MSFQSAIRIHKSDANIQDTKDGESFCNGFGMSLATTGDYKSQLKVPFRIQLCEQVSALKIKTIGLSVETF